jgi:hypothetical protein
MNDSSGWPSATSGSTPIEAPLSTRPICRRRTGSRRPDVSRIGSPAPRNTRLLSLAAWLLLVPGAVSAAPPEREPTGCPLESAGDVSPVFDGWYRAAGGARVLVFGYFSRDAMHPVEVPLGPSNRIEPIQYDGAQPTHFQPRPRDEGPGRGLRHWGVFTIAVPADAADTRVVWTVRSGCEDRSVVGHATHPGYELRPFGSSDRPVAPPAIRLEPEGPAGRGPSGVSLDHIRKATPGVPLEIPVWVDSASAPPVVLRWFKHQGSGDVHFESREAPVNMSIGVSVTRAVFSKPGRYVLRVRATDAATEFDRHCCWTNGYLVVEVAP